jgi:hypothetical protein
MRSPDLTPEDIAEALRYAAEALHMRFLVDINLSFKIARPRVVAGTYNSIART